jgi:2-isopropylmalate synthase
VIHFLFALFLNVTDMSKRIQIFDTTLRDGEQVPGSRLTPHEKLEIAIALDELGVDIIELGFPCSSPNDFKVFELVGQRISRPIFCALSRAVESDIKIAGEALKFVKHGRIHTGIGTSPSHIKYKFNCNQDQIIERAVAAVKYAKTFVHVVEFYAEDAGRSDNAFLAQVLEKAIAAGASVLNIADTTGYCLPDQYGQKIKYLYENVKGIDKVTVSAHCHNDLGLATANTIAGIENGVGQVECTINGVGERAGNTSLEEVVMVLKQHKMGYYTNIQCDKLTGISHLVSDRLNVPVQPNKAIVGKNAFSHSSGIHQDGVIKNAETYEIINPREVGAAESQIILTARSGRAAVDFAARKIGHILSKEKLEHDNQRFISLADQERNISYEKLGQVIQSIG